MEIFFNFPLIAALSAIIFAQVIKIPIRFALTHEFRPKLAFSTGGMPSSHSAAVSALTTGVGLVDGIGTTTFAVSTVFSIIIMFDASGVRRQAGEHAIVLNQLIRDFQYIIEEAKGWQQKEAYEKRNELKEILGHQPIEVFFGCISGVVLSLLLYNIW